jgi:UDP-N-acetylmuramoyl-tripeptide--D-alanyl-D-alanine ligase
MTFGFEQAADVTGKSTCMVWKAASASARRRARFEVLLALPGQHNARNALAAATACLAAGVSLDAVQAGLASFSWSQGPPAATGCPAWRGAARRHL